LASREEMMFKNGFQNGNVFIYGCGKIMEVNPDACT
jgi:hypothetical protein